MPERVRTLVTNFPEVCRKCSTVLVSHPSTRDGFRLRLDCTLAQLECETGEIPTYKQTAGRINTSNIPEGCPNSYRSAENLPVREG